MIKIVLEWIVIVLLIALLINYLLPKKKKEEETKFNTLEELDKKVEEKVEGYQEAVNDVKAAEQKLDEIKSKTNKN